MPNLRMAKPGGDNASVSGAVLYKGDVPGEEEAKGQTVNYYQGAKHKAWREKVLRRDKYLCQECLRYGKKIPATHAHHVKHREDYPDLQYVVSNGRALCAMCHNKAHPEKGGRRSGNKL